MIAVLVRLLGRGGCITHTFTYTPANERMLSRELCYFGANYGPKTLHWHGIRQHRSLNMKTCVGNPSERHAFLWTATAPHLLPFWASPTGIWSEECHPTSPSWSVAKTLGTFCEHTKRGRTTYQHACGRFNHYCPTTTHVQTPPPPSILNPEVYTCIKGRYGLLLCTHVTFRALIPNITFV
jgi:hypothetical protein